MNTLDHKITHLTKTGSWWGTAAGSQVLKEASIAACITDPPYNYEFIGHKWEYTKIERRLDKVKTSNTLVKNIPYGSGLAGGVRNERWYKKTGKTFLNIRIGVLPGELNFFSLQTWRNCGCVQQ